MLNLVASLVFATYFSGDPAVPKGQPTDGLIRTVTGDANRGDGLPARQAIFLDAGHLTVDENDNIYISDRFDHRVRRVTAATGRIDTVVGTGQRGSGGDGGPALAAQLSFPGDIEFDQFGNLYVADAGNQRIRRIDGETGITTTIAGGGDRSLLEDGPALEARFDSPIGLGYDRATHSLLVSDRGLNMVTRIDLATGFMELVAGTGQRGFTGDGVRATNSALSVPEDVAVDSRGRIIIADTGSHRLRFIDPVSGVLGTLAGDGNFGFVGNGIPAGLARLFAPLRVVVDENDAIFFADSGNFRVRRIDPMTNQINTVIGNGIGGSRGDGGSATSASTTPFGIAITSVGDLIVAEGAEQKVRRLTANGVLTTVAGGAGFSSTATCTAGLADGLVDEVGGIDVDANGLVYLVDSGTHTVSIVDILSATSTVVAGQRGRSGFAGDGGQASTALLDTPTDIAVAGDSLFIADLGNRRVGRVDCPDPR